ncbi:hypothetical protein V8E52_008744 [Russula decolorans]
MTAHRLIIEVCTTFRRSTWRKDLLESAGVTQNCLNVARGCATIASINFVIIVPLVFERGEIRRGYMGHYPVFLDCLEWLGEEALRPSSGNNVPVPMDGQAPSCEVSQHYINHDGCMCGTARQPKINLRSRTEIVIVFHRWRNTEYCTEGPDRPVKVVEKAAAIVLPSEHYYIACTPTWTLLIIAGVAQSPPTRNTRGQPTHYEHL